MRDHILLCINGEEHRVSGEDVFIPLVTYLRRKQGWTGTKVVCEEGDCGACSVIVGRLDGDHLEYAPVNSCILFVYQLDCAHVITIEGINGNGDLNPVQKSMMECHGTQCGFCTPGFVMTMSSMYDRKDTLDRQEIIDGLTGNLCRCTGYDPIIKAALSVQREQIVPLKELYPQDGVLKVLKTERSQPVEVRTEEHQLFVPKTLQQALELKNAHPDAVVVSGGTDVGVYWNKLGSEPGKLIALSGIPDMGGAVIEGDCLIAGGALTLSGLLDVCREHVAEFARLLVLFGSPQIRNAGTLAGNIANGSPIGDTLPFLMVMEAELELASVKGTRRLNINKLYTGYKKLDMAPNELITRIFIPLPDKQEHLRLYKVSRREHLDIATAGAAFRFKINNGKVESARIAYGGVAPVARRLPRLEAFLIGKDFTLETMSKASRLVADEISPISDVRGSREYRSRLSENLLLKFYWETVSSKEAACRH